MKLTQKVKYAVLCLLELARRYGDHVDAQRLSEIVSIPTAYAQKIMQALAHAGIVVSHKGVGYRLARPLADITALQVLEALAADPAEAVATGDVADPLERRINQALDTVTLAELVR